MIEKNFGMLAAVDWNSNHWQDLSTNDDLTNSNFGYVKEHNITFTCLNFAHEIYPSDAKGFYQGLLPQLWSRMPDKEKARYIKIAFIRSLNYHDGINYLVGFYAFPEFKKDKKISPLSSFPIDFEINIRALAKDIHLIENPINLTVHPELKKFLPKNKELGKQGYNYLTKANVFKIMDTLTALNPVDTRLHSIKGRLITSINRI